MGVLKNKVYAVADIAKAFIALFQNDADGITSLKLQKLLLKMKMLKIII